MKAIICYYEYAKRAILKLLEEKLLEILFIMKLIIQVKLNDI